MCRTAVATLVGIATMTTETTPPSLHPAIQGMRATLLGIAINILLATGKALAGVFGHSYALIADAIESATDVVSSILVYVGLRVSARPPDENHPYGHGKAEPLATVAVALFLFFAAYNIGWHSVKQIRDPHIMPAPWTLIVLVAVVVIKEILFRFVSRVGEDVGSSALKGDAFHHRSDALTSAAAFIGIAVALIGHWFHPDPRWSSADDWAALIASFVIARNGWEICKGAVLELTDIRPSGDIETAVRRIALTVPNVTSLHKCIVRKVGFDYYVDLDVRVDRNMPVYQAHVIAHQVQSALRGDISGVMIAKVLVHIEPEPVKA